ncbi:MAG: SRPBCC domain-containing protein [Saprospiraceae bacterium]|nr:SRPBCC domain-containing protein [Saprospiraceae bacterium]
MDNNLISESTIPITATPATIWEVLTNPDIAKEYLHGAKIDTDWKVKSAITLSGEFNGNKYVEKGILLEVRPFVAIRYTHWSPFDGLPDLPENYRIWSYSLEAKGNKTLLKISEDNIPTEKQKNRSDEFWRGVLFKIKQLCEHRKMQGFRDT